MKLKHIILATAVTVGFVSAPSARAWDIKDLFGGSSGETIANVIEGVFTKTNLEVKDLAGTWQATGPAVTFKSDNFLQKAGGLAGAATIETKLKPYYEKYGLTGAEIAIAEDGQMSMKIKKLNLKGTVTKGKESGTFEFSFKAFGAVKITALTAYVEKSPSNLNIMFDATKLKQFISVVANLSGMQLAKAVSSVLDSYEGACIGFKMKSVGAAPEKTASGTIVKTAPPTSEKEKTESPKNTATDLLKGILGGTRKK